MHYKCTLHILPDKSIVTADKFPYFSRPVCEDKKSLCSRLFPLVSYEFYFLFTFLLPDLAREIVAMTCLKNLDFLALLGEDGS